MTDAAASFEPHRRHLRGLAYRMLGSLADAEDVVQDAYLRWHGARRDSVDDPRRFLSTVVTRLCLDLLKSARVRREAYVGPWLPEPVLDAAALAPESGAELAEDLSVALLLTLERLSPLERAAFLLHDVFGLGFDAVAEALGRKEAACRQLAARARAHVREGRPRFRASREAAAALAAAFMRASATGDPAALGELLARDAVLLTDGGGKRIAARNPIVGAGKIVRFFVKLAQKGRPQRYVAVEPATINGLPGFVLRDVEGFAETIAFEPDGVGRIAAIYHLRNPEKLRGVANAPATPARRADAAAR
jgi:RNA polymerase sigma-70 factor (ECF subfamily)